LDVTLSYNLWQPVEVVDFENGMKTNNKTYVAATSVPQLTCNGNGNKHTVLQLDDSNYTFHQKRTTGYYQVLERIFYMQKGFNPLIRSPGGIV
jgi:hypothetical protein